MSPILGRFNDYELTFRKQELLIYTHLLQKSTDTVASTHWDRLVNLKQRKIKKLKKTTVQKLIFSSIYPTKTKVLEFVSFRYYIFSSKGKSMNTMVFTKWYYINETNFHSVHRKPHCVSTRIFENFLSSPV